MLDISFREHRKLTCEQVVSVVKSHPDLGSYLLLNKLEYMLLAEHGYEIVTNHSDNIRVITGYILIDNMKELFAMYETMFDQYIDQTKNDSDRIDGFNILFVVWIHISLKILRNLKNFEEVAV